MSNTAVLPRYETQYQQPWNNQEDPYTLASLEGLGSTQAIAPVEGYYNQYVNTRVLDNDYAFEVIVELARQGVDPTLPDEHRIDDHAKLIGRYYDDYYTGRLHLVERRNLQDADVLPTYFLESPDMPTTTQMPEQTATKEEPPKFIRSNNFPALSWEPGKRSEHGMRMRPRPEGMPYNRSEGPGIDVTDMYRGAKRGMHIPNEEAYLDLRPSLRRSAPEGSQQMGQHAVGYVAVSGSFRHETV